MAFKAVFIVVLYFFASCGAQHNCNETQCNLLLLDDNVAADFRKKSSEKGVRIVYLNLKIGNESYHPLELEDEFLPERWVWAKTISEPMLSLSYDYDILSLGLLNNQVRSLSVPLEESPSGCVARLNSSCQNVIIGRALLHNVTRKSRRASSSGVVCVAMILKNLSFYERRFEGNVKFNCCEANADESLINCKLVTTSDWLDAVHHVLNGLTVIILFYCAALPIVLPDWIFSLEEECKKQNALQQSNTTEESMQLNEFDGAYSEISNTNLDAKEDEIPVDDNSPVTCSSMFRQLRKELPDLPFSFNIKLMVFLFFIIPFFFYIDMALNFTIKNKFIVEEYRKPATELSANPVSWIDSSSAIFWVKLVAAVIIPFVVIMFMRPTTLKAALSNTKSNCFVCGKSPSSLGLEHIVEHLQTLQLQVYGTVLGLIRIISWLFKVVSCSLKPSCQSVAGEDQGHYSVVKKQVFSFLCTIIVIASLVVIICFSPALFLLILVALLLIYSPLFCTVQDFGDLLGHISYGIVRWITNKCPGCEFESTKCTTVCNCLLKSILVIPVYAVMLLIYIYELAFLVFVFLMVSTSCRFVVRMFGFVIMGLVVNAKILSPFLSFFIVATTNMYLCYSNLQNRYKEVKELISKQWQELIKNVTPSAETGLSRGSDKTIPKDLFWFVCGGFFCDPVEKKVLPIGTEVIRMVRNMTSILLFLFLTLSSIVFFQNSFDVSAVASSIAMFVTGAIPGLFIKGLTTREEIKGWKKIDTEEKIKEAVNEYIRRANGRTQCTRSCES